jgi:hypothetical protein
MATRASFSPLWAPHSAQRDAVLAMSGVDHPAGSRPQAGRHRARRSYARTVDGTIPRAHAQDRHKAGADGTYESTIGSSVDDRHSEGVHA